MALGGWPWHWARGRGTSEGTKPLEGTSRTETCPHAGHRPPSQGSGASSPQSPPITRSIPQKPTLGSGPAHPRVGVTTPSGPRHAGLMLIKCNAGN